MAEFKYTPIGKFCLALYFAAVKLKHYLMSVVVYVIAQTDVFKYMLSRPLLKGRVIKWSLALIQFDLVYVSKNSVKGQALADFLADHPCLNIEQFEQELFKAWNAYIYIPFLLEDRASSIGQCSHLREQELSLTQTCFKDLPPTIYR